MRILRFSVLLLVVLALFVGAQSSQNPQPAPSQKTAAVQSPDGKTNQTQAPAGNQNSAGKAQPQSNPWPHFKLKLFPPKQNADPKKFPTGTLDRGFRASVSHEASGPSHLLAFNQIPEFQPGSGTQSDRIILSDQPDSSPYDLRSEVDPGIYAQTAGRGRICGTIVSYNFSFAEDDQFPQLKDVTTCTPTDRIIQRRAHAPARGSREPLVLQTTYPEN